METRWRSGLSAPAANCRERQENVRRILRILCSLWLYGPQRDDPHWFGARIPGTPQSVEFVEVGHTTGYRKFAGTGLAEVHVSAVSAAERMSFVAGLTPVQLP